MSTYEQTIARLIRIAVAGTVVIVGLWVSPGTIAAISGHGDIELAVSVMWSMIRPLHPVRNRLPSLGCQGLREARGPAAAQRASMDA